MDITERTFEKKVVRAYRNGDAALPIVYSNDYLEAGEKVLAVCADIGCAPFNLVTMSHIGWDQSMSPWPSEPVAAKNDHFTGKAPEHLAWILDEVVPFAEAALGVQEPTCYISGYSMAGLFALWSAYQTDCFRGVVCASGSLWFPGFRDFALKGQLACNPQGIYLSLGDRESKVRNPALQVTDGVYRELEAHYASLGIPCIYEVNPGNHFRDMGLRVAKGIAWLLSLSRDAAGRNHEPTHRGTDRTMLS